MTIKTPDEFASTSSGVKTTQQGDFIMFEITLHQQDFSDGDVQQTIDGRDVYYAMEIKKDYSTWVQDQIASLKMSLNVNYIKVFPQKGENSGGGRPTIEYHFTIESAKHIALVSRTQKGAEYRQALINLEKQVAQSQHIIANRPTREAVDIVQDYLDLAKLCEVPKHLALIEASKATRAIGVDIAGLLQQSSAMEDIKSSEVMLEPTELASVLGFKSAKSMNKMLEQLGLQSRIAGHWVATDRADGMYYKHAWQNNGKSGYNLKWNVAKVEEQLSNMLEERD